MRINDDDDDDDEVPKDTERKKIFASSLLFAYTWISLEHRVQVEGSLYAKNQLDPSNHFSRTATCDRHR